MLGQTIAFRFPRKEGEQPWSNHCLHAERLSHGQEALHLIVAPGHRDSIQNMFTGALQADTAHIMVPAAGSFTIDNHKAGEIQGQRLDSSSRLITLWRVKQICIPTVEDTKETSCDSQVCSTWCRVAAETFCATLRRMILVSLQRCSTAHESRDAEG